ncbi:hypothetical protein GALMADRAFT_131616 [Galerina marginata CBS 339.88]|uniref:poly(ADP-ribose) glycohydrolase n=1 Tax=Galerina marginata (strain CBS 339.88) TaxID=685588 RepID=A0A067TR87_GALM3|nr:hypothetical protein GALMADRAFT_131616 [Galerina marginata CBS 339.88]
MDSSGDYYVLPSHPSLASLDPLGICADENPSVWAVITTSVLSFRNQPAPTGNLHHLPHLIEDLSYSVHMDGHLDTRFLSSHLLAKYPDPHSPNALLLLHNILDAALLLPTLFPIHMIPYLNTQNCSIQLSTTQIRSLLAHQILNTLKRPKGNDWGCTFVCWYSEPQALGNAVSGYLTSLFDYFSLLADPTIQTTYRYHTLLSDSPERELSGWTTDQKTPLFDHLIINPTTSAAVPFPHKQVSCTLVASNSSPGFGPSCTQEELVTAACPPLLPLGALFISPPISSNAAVSVNGHVPIFRWKGQGREARSLGTHISGEHTFLFLDASELDTSNSTFLADLDPKYLFRDLHKAFSGFLALKELGIKEVASPLWGAGAFGGDPVIKTIILTAAAARTGTTLYLSVDEQRSYQTIGAGLPESPEPLNLIYILQRLQQSCRMMPLEVAMQKLCSKQAYSCSGGLDLLQSLENTS